MNTTALLEAHFAVPLAGRVLVAINYRLLPKEVLYIIRHSGAKMLFFDARLSRQVMEILPKLRKIPSFKLFQIGELNEQDVKTDGCYENLVIAKEGSLDLGKFRLGSEKALIAIDYTSGTTGVPKGVIIPIVELISMHWRILCIVGSTKIQSICGHYPCSIATGGALVGQLLELVLET